MALAFPCTFCTPFQLKTSPINRRYSPSIRPQATSSEFRIPVEISSPADRGSLAVPTHKVTVHDRQRGVVHEFEVPEVSGFDPYVSLILPIMMVAPWLYVLLKDENVF